MSTPHTTDTPMALPAQPRTTGTPIDVEHLARYTMGDHELEREILGLFIQTLDQSEHALQHAQDPAVWSMAAHTLKGSARAVGAWRIAELMVRAEKITAQPQSNRACSDILTDLAQAAVAAKTFIARLTGNPARA